MPISTKLNTFNNASKRLKNGDGKGPGNSHPPQNIVFCSHGPELRSGSHKLETTKSLLCRTIIKTARRIQLKLVWGGFLTFRLLYISSPSGAKNTSSLLAEP
jgi:hypothetical protein